MNKAAAKPKRKVSTAPEPRRALEAQDHVEPEVLPSGATEQELANEVDDYDDVESIGDGTDDTEPLTEDEIDDSDDEGYF